MTASRSRAACPARTATRSSPGPRPSPRCTTRSRARFYLTDFLAKHFDALVWQGLGLDRHPQLRDAYFGNYRRVVLLSQTDDPAVAGGRPSRGRARSGSTFEHRHDRASTAVRRAVERLAPTVRTGGLT